MEQIYTSESKGSDETGDGSKENPFKTVLQVRYIENLCSILIIYNGGVSFY